MATAAPMTPEAVRAAREALGLTPEELAAELGLTPAVISAWEAGSVPASGHHARLLAWRAAAHARAQALEASGLPPCPTADALGARLEEPKADVGRVAAELERHAAGCPTCRAWAEYAATLPPLPEYPHGVGMRAVTALADRIGRLPRWLRPAAWGALLVGGMVLVRVLLAAVAGGASWRLLGLAAGALLLGGYLGAIGGIAYHLVRPRTRKLGRPGDYLTGIACAAAYMAAFLLPAALLGDDEFARTTEGWLVGGGLSVLFGLVLGHFFRDT